MSILIIVFSTEVFEHVFNIDEVLPEINRVLKKEWLPVHHLSVCLAGT